MTLLKRLEAENLSSYPRYINPDGPEAAALIRDMEAMLGEAENQLSYLNGKFTPTGTTAAVIARITSLRAKVSQP